MSAKAKRRKLARKVVREYLKRGVSDPYVFDTRVTETLNDKQFDRLIKEIRKAKVTVTWGRR